MGRKNPKSKARHVAAPSSQLFYSVLLLLILLFVSYVRLRLRSTSLERDEGEYAYAAQLMLQGIPPYQLAYNMKLPGTYAAYALLMAVFGQTPSGIHLGLLAINLATIVIIFLLARRLCNGLAGVTAAAAYAVLSLSPSVLGFAGHATHFVVLAACAGTFLLLKSIDNGRALSFFWTGLLFGLAYLMKQPGIFFMIFAVVYMLSRESSPRPNYAVLWKKLGFFFGGAILPFTLTCLILWRAHVFKTFWFWTVSYAYEYATRMTLHEGIHLFWSTLQAVTAPALWIWLIAAVGLSTVFWDRAVRAHARFLLTFTLFSFLAVCPGLLFRSHYFILFLPAASLLAGVAIDAGTRAIQSAHSNRFVAAIPAVIFAVALAIAIQRQKDFFFHEEPDAAIRRIYSGNPFIEAQPIADYIRQHSPDTASIAILGSEPEIYFYSHRRSATGYIYTYPLMEEQKFASQMQQEMIHEIEAARPDYLIFVTGRTSWLAGPNSDRTIFNWSQKYQQENYDPTGIADIQPNGTQYRWDAAVKSYRPQSHNLVMVFKRKPGV